ADLDAIEAQLAEHIAQLPQFFLHSPVMVDVDALRGSPVDFAQLAALLRSNHLVPIAVRNLDDAQKAAAVAGGWGVLQSAVERPTQASAARGRSMDPAAPAPQRVELPVGLTLSQPVRSGQVVHAPRGDMVALAAVSTGAELVADGNIHVYAPLRGRALAGVNGNPEASIFSMSLQAEFLSIAGQGMTSEQIPEACRGKPARVHLEVGRLVVTALL
ncbi:MAG: septum site-determining protein MinC, partial [Polyangiaceae bacterium]|nr:septum site-determining protein MinC [Polyangiaceae bacterium]